MSTFERFERSIPALMDELAPAQTPDYFDDLLRTTATHRQRPAWSSPERWLPVEITARPLVTRSVPWRPFAVLALLVLAGLVGLVAYVGAQPRLPPPFGAAANGVLLFRAVDGSITSLEPRTGELNTVAPASDALGEPIPSRDGRRVAFVPKSETLERVVVAGVDGTDRVLLAGEYRFIDAVDWSPDGAHLAFVADSGGTASITVAATDGSGAVTLPLERNVWQIRYLPDGRLAIVAGERPGQLCPTENPPAAPCALFLVNADGSGLEKLLPAAEFHGLGLDPSPDGSKLTYVEWVAPDIPGRIHLFDLGDRTDQLLPTEGFPREYAINRALFSPDGRSILFDFFEADGDHWAIVPASGGAAVRIGPEWPGDAPDAAWAPDGRSVLSRYPTRATTSELWLLDATNAGVDRRLDVEVPYIPEWQRAGPSD